MASRSRSTAARVRPTSFNAPPPCKAATRSGKRLAWLRWTKPVRLSSPTRMRQRARAITGSSLGEAMDGRLAPEKDAEGCIAGAERSVPQNQRQLRPGGEESLRGPQLQALFWEKTIWQKRQDENSIRRT